jgi:hypothetical protein
MATRRSDSSRSWTLIEALDFIRRLEPFVEPAGYHVGLLGSVLLKGDSEKDLDVLLYPHDMAQQDHARLQQALLAADLCPLLSVANIHDIWRRKGSNDTKRVESWLFGRKRVDLFLLT